MENIASNSTYANGEEPEMQGLVKLIETVIASKDIAAFVASTDKLNEEYEQLQNTLAQVQINGHLVGDCPILKGDALI